MFGLLKPIYMPSEFMQFIHFTAIAGFIVTSTLVINLNHKLFNYVMKDNAKKFWWLFVILAIIPLSLFLYAFTLIFGKLLV